MLNGSSCASQEVKEPAAATAQWVAGARRQQELEGNRWILETHRVVPCEFEGQDDETRQHIAQEPDREDRLLQVLEESGRGVIPAAAGSGAKRQGESND